MIGELDWKRQLVRVSGYNEIFYHTPRGTIGLEAGFVEQRSGLYTPYTRGGCPLSTPQKKLITAKLIVLKFNEEQAAKEDK